MTVAQVEALLSASAGLGPWWRAYVYTGIMCGLRPGELLGLRWEDVDAAGHINASITRAVYRHVLADKLSAAASVMDATFRASGGAS
jgi:integrase